MSQIYFILEWHSPCFGQSFRPSSGVHDCTYSNRHMTNRYCCLLASRQTAVSVWHIPVAVCTVLNSCWWTERPSETCIKSFQNKINLRHWCIWLVLLYEYITMHGPTNVKSYWITKATNRLSEYVIRIAFPLQQWLHELKSEGLHHGVLR